MKIEVIVGNIVKQADMEAVVNSANAQLRLGSGVAGAIHTAAGPKLEEYCKPFAPLAYGAFLVTPGFKLPNLWVIHVRAASYTHHDDAPAILEQALQAAIQGAHQNDIRTMALPAIGTGVFAFPPILAAQWLQWHSTRQILGAMVVWVGKRCKGRGPFRAPRNGESPVGRSVQRA